jgi:hypothetical protein
MGEHADLRDVVGVYDGHRVRGVGLGAGLVAEYPEGQHRGVDRAVVGEHRRDKRAVRVQVVGVELPGVHGRRTGGDQGGDLLGELVGLACRQYHRRPGSQAPREFHTDLAAAAEDQHRRSPRVIHGCDYHLR